MSLATNKKLRANNFVCVIAQNPELLTCNSYLNFLRTYKAQHPRLGLRKILQNGFKIWSKLNDSQRKSFKQKKYGAAARTRIKPRLKWAAKKRLQRIPPHRMPKSKGKFLLNAQKNIEKRRRIIGPLKRYQPKKMPAHYTKLPAV